MRLLVLLLGFTCLGLGTTQAMASPPGQGHGHLPPGLEKKVARGDTLPPGWQKKLQVGGVLDRDVYRHGVIIGSSRHDGIVDLRVDDRIIRLVEDSREIVDILRSY